MGTGTGKVISVCLLLMKQHVLLPLTYYDDNE